MRRRRRRRGGAIPTSFRSARTTSGPRGGRRQRRRRGGMPTKTPSSSLRSPLPSNSGSFLIDSSPPTGSGCSLSSSRPSKGIRLAFVIPLWNFRGHTGNAIVDFRKDWSGFKDAMAFENYFDIEHFGKRDWYERKHRGSEIYGWVARADDYHLGGPIGELLRKNGDLKTVKDLAMEESRKTNKLVANLESQIEVKDGHLQELECKFNESTMSLNKMMEQRDVLLQASQ